MYEPFHNIQFHDSYLLKTHGIVIYGIGIGRRYKEFLDIFVPSVTILSIKAAAAAAAVETKAAANFIPDNREIRGLSTKYSSLHNRFTN